MIELVLPPGNTIEQQVDVALSDKGIGITGSGTFDGKRFTYGKISTVHPLTKKPLVILIHRKNQDDVVEFKFKENVAVEFEWIKFGNKYTAKNVRYITNDVRYKAINSLLDKSPERVTMSKAHLQSIVFAEFNLRDNRGEKPEEQAQAMLESVLNKMKMSIIGRSNDFVTLVKNA